MSIRQGNKVLSAGQSLTQNLFDFKWADHILDDIQWLRADTFTWHDGRVYEAAYQHLLAEWNEVGDVPSTETIADTQIYYRLAPDGHKICSASQEDEAVAIYEATGIAWYYILDTTNQRFKLPRTKFGFVGLRDNDVGKYIPESLPNITGEFDNMLNGTLKDGGYPSGLTTINTSGAFTGVKKANTDWHIDTTNIATNQNGHYAASFDASRSSSVYQNNAPVQERSTQMYLYFFVGNFAQSAVVNTAGINATLIEEIQNTKQDIATAVNYNNITNCITEIPQDINLELSSGALKLKAGSKLYQPNGSGIFTPITIDSDKQRSDFSAFGSGTYLLFRSTGQYTGGGGLIAINITTCVSGTTDTSTASIHAWYDTTNNVIKTYEGGTYKYTDLSLPIAIISITYGTGVTSIDQVFNGFGYIGYTVFALPGVKGLIPDGRNADGSLKSIEFTLISPITMLQTVSGWNGRWSVYTNGISLSYHPTELEYISDTKPIVSTPTAYWFCPKDNILYWTSDTGATWSISKALHVADLTESSMKIQSLNWKQPFKAVDYSEADFVIDFQRPTAANNHTWYRKYKSGWVEQGGLAPSGSAHPYSVVLPITMSNSNYSVQLSISDSSPTDNNLSVCSWNNCTTTGFNIYRAYNGNSHPSSSVWWEVKGFVA